MDTIQIEIAASPLVWGILIMQASVIIWFVHKNLKLISSRDYWKINHRREWFKNNLGKKKDNES